MILYKYYTVPPPRSNSHWHVQPHSWPWYLKSLSTDLINKHAHSNPKDQVFHELSVWVEIFTDHICPVCLLGLWELHPVHSRLLPRQQATPALQPTTALLQGLEAGAEGIIHRPQDRHNIAGVSRHGCRLIAHCCSWWPTMASWPTCTSHSYSLWHWDLAGWFPSLPSRAWLLDVLESIAALRPCSQIQWRHGHLSYHVYHCREIIQLLYWLFNEWKSSISPRIL